MTNYIPYLYRYENEKWIDDFFTNGNIKLSSFHNYKSYLDNELGDKDEGNSYNVINGNNNKSTHAFTFAKDNSYCFCTSIVLDKALKSTFSRSSAFRIKDPLAFIVEISKSIPRLSEVIYGNCLYLPERGLISNIDEPISVDRFAENGNVDIRKIIAETNTHFSPDTHFLKQMKYQSQSEYRMLWFTDREVTDGMVIHCPEAVKYCERIQF